VQNTFHLYYLNELNSMHSQPGKRLGRTSRKKRKRPINQDSRLWYPSPLSISCWICSFSLTSNLYLTQLYPGIELPKHNSISLCTSASPLPCSSYHQKSYRNNRRHSPIGKSPASLFQWPSSPEFLTEKHNHLFCQLWNLLLSPNQSFGGIKKYHCLHKSFWVYHNHSHCDLCG
jgi:hypothetical protein